jgi:trk system potassium uptake protein
VHVVVVGCGRVGSGLAVALESQGHSVAVIDRRPESLTRLPEDFAGQRIVGVGFDRSRLTEAGIERAGALAAVTNGDNSNIVVARVAREAFQVERVVARIYDPRRAAIYERNGIPTVASVQWSIDRVLRRVLPDVPTVEWIDPSARICLVERVLPDSWAGRRVDELEPPGLAKVAAVSRFGKGQLTTPDLVLQEGDLLWAMVDGDHTDDFDQHLAAGPAKGKH